MKKKLLSLVLAGAMVASTSVSAFAATGTETIIRNPENETGEAEITITGEVTGNDGSTVPGTLNVTVPTTASFAITKDGKFTAPQITITNNGTQTVDVLAYQFIDVDGPENGIKITKSTEVSNKSDMTLNISGGFGTAYFKSETDNVSNKGVYTNQELTKPANNDGVKIADIAGGGTVKELTLNGTAGENNGNKAARNKFTLKLKIKKSAKQSATQPSASEPQSPAPLETQHSAAQ